MALAVLLRCNANDFFKAARGVVGGCKAKDGSNFGNWLIGPEQHGFKTADPILNFILIDRLAGFLFIKMGQIIFVALQVMSQVIQRVILAAVIAQGSLDFLRSASPFGYFVVLLSFLNALNKDLTGCLQSRV